MSRTLYNLRLLGDKPLRDRALEIFLDSYAASIDIYPRSHSRARLPKGADSLWMDFARVSQDAAHAIHKRTSQVDLEARLRDRKSVEQLKERRGGEPKNKNN